MKEKEKKKSKQSAIKMSNENCTDRTVKLQSMYSFFFFVYVSFACSTRKKRNDFIVQITRSLSFA